MTPDGDLQQLKVESIGAGWALAGPASSAFELVNDYLSYLGDRRYSPRTVRSYAFRPVALLPVVAGRRHVAGSGDHRVLLR